jgi:hypothetical protein
MIVDNEHAKTIADVRVIVASMMGQRVPRGTIVAMLLELFALVVAETTLPGEIDAETTR